ncbi:MAG: hypothetical protein B7C54_10710 [Acidimicrobiales bacterium mtb01]|nr:Gfo/Idh/MocA family oxidoreductase [Actinomycetota bacterium]TEX45536.1 MAG: hypothetical protein B7C54_10710 [Acidimicrobiales bacterium mtb01]
MTWTPSPRSSHNSPDTDRLAVNQPTVALCGAGLITGAHALAASSLGVPIVAVASRTRTRAEERAAQIRPAARVVEYEQLPAGADIVIVATPPGQHLEHAAHSLSRGAAVLLEKPLVRTLAEADRLVSLGGTVLYGENLAFAPLFTEFVQRARTIGTITHFELRTLQSAPTWGGFLSPEWGGGALFDLGIHPLALAVLVARATGNGEVVAARADLRGDTTDTHAEAVIEFASGLEARIVSSWEGPEAGVWDMQVSSKTSVVRADLRPEVGLEVNGDPIALPKARHPIPFIEQFGYEDQLRALVDSVRGGHASAIDAGFGRWMLEIVCACYVSAARGGETIPVPSGCARDKSPWELWKQS